MTKQVKRNVLLRKLISKIIKNNNLNNLNIKVRIHKSRGSGGSYTVDWNNNYEISLSRLTLRIKSMNKISRKGYSDDYYNGRGNKLMFLKNNRHLNYRFVILHEIGHLVDCNNLLKSKINPNKIPLRIKEDFADNFAIQNLNTYK